MGFLREPRAEDPRRSELPKMRGWEDRFVSPWPKFWKYISLSISYRIFVIYFIDSPINKNMDLGMNAIRCRILEYTLTDKSEENKELIYTTTIDGRTPDEDQPHLVFMSTIRLVYEQLAGSYEAIDDDLNWADNEGTEYDPTKLDNVDLLVVVNEESVQVIAKDKNVVISACKALSYHGEWTDESTWIVDNFAIDKIMAPGYQGAVMMPQPPGFSGGRRSDP